MRPLVDAWLYQTIQSRVWTRDDFGETRDGVCRILPPLTHALSETAPDWYSAVAPSVEHVAKALHATIDTLALPSAYVHVQGRGRLAVRPMGARLTNANKLRTRSAAAVEPKPLLPACRVCGVVADASGLYCEDCNPATAMERERLEHERLVREQARERSATVVDLPAAETPAERHTRVLQEQRQRMLDFERRYAGVRFDAGVYRARILPALVGLNPDDIARALGVVRQTASRYSDGRSVAHPRFWESLARLAGIDGFSLDDARAGAVVCTVCGRPTDGRTYCSAACRNRARLAYARARYQAKREATGQPYKPRARHDTTEGSGDGA